MNWKHYDTVILGKLKPRSKKSTKSQTSLKMPKPQLEGLDSLLSNPILINLDNVSVTSQVIASEKLQRFSYTCCVCDGNFPSSYDEQRHDCEYDDTMTNSSVTSRDACNSTLNQSNMTSDLSTSDLSRSFSEDKEISNSSDDSFSEFLPQAKSCQFFTESPNKSKKRRLMSDKASTCRDVLSESTMTSELTRSSSEDSGFSSLGDDSICGSLPRAKSCQFFTESPNKSKKRRWSSPEYKHDFMPEQKCIHVQIPC